LLRWELGDGEAANGRGDREAFNFDSFMLDSPFVAGRLLPKVPRGGMRPIISNLRRNPSSTGGHTLTVRNRVGDSGFGKGPQTQQATVARTASGILALVARPS
jgi:hypothetical protein